MYIATIPNRGSPPAILLRHSYRLGTKVKTRTLANLTDWPEHKVETLKRLLRGETLVSPQDVFAIESSVPHGHVQAVLGSIRKLLAAVRKRGILTRRGQLRPERVMGAGDSRRSFSAIKGWSLAAR